MSPATEAQMRGGDGADDASFRDRPISRCRLEAAAQVGATAALRWARAPL